jgi:hypothetical protein
LFGIWFGGQFLLGGSIFVEVLLDIAVPGFGESLGELASESILLAVKVAVLTLPLVLLGGIAQRRLLMPGAVWISLLVLPAAATVSQLVATGSLLTIVSGLPAMLAVGAAWFYLNRLYPTPPPAADVPETASPA